MDEESDLVLTLEVLVGFALIGTMYVVLSLVALLFGLLYLPYWLLRGRRQGDDYSGPDSVVLDARQRW